MNCMCRALFMSNSLSSVWGHSVPFATVPKLYSKVYYSHIFHPISTKFYVKYGNQGEIQIISFLALCQSFKIDGALISHLSYIDIIHKAMLGSSGKLVKQIVKAPGPLAV